MTIKMPLEWQPSAGKHLFGLGLLVFLCAKLYLVVLFTYLAGAPRQGDDSYVYLWKGILASRNYDASSPAVSDIRKFAASDTTADDGLMAKQARVVMRTQGALSPLYDQLTAWCLKIIGNAKWTIGALEILGILVMSASIGVFLSALFGTLAAGIGLILMAFVILPNQGISHFIPSTLTLSLGMLTWGLLLKQQRDSTVVVACVIAALLPGIHPIGKLYAGVTALIYGVSLWKSEEPFSWRRWLILALVIGTGIGASVALPAIFPSLAPPPTSQLGGISGYDGVVQNVRSAANLLWETLKRCPHVFAVIALGLAFIRRFVAPPVALSVAGLLAVVMLGALLHTLPGYPAELFARLLVPAIVIFAGYGGYVFVKAYEYGPHRRWLIAAFILSMLPVVSYWVASYGFNERRPFVIDDASVKTELMTLPTEKPLLYIDTDLSLMVALINGADRFGAVLLPMIGSSETLKNILNERKPLRAVVQVPNNLNTVVSHGTRKFVRQRYGFLFSATDSLTIQPGNGELEQVYGLIRNNGPELSIPIQGACTKAECPRADWEKLIVVPKNSHDWVELWSPLNNATTALSIQLPTADAWLEGLRSVPDDPQVLWPWNEGWEGSYHMRTWGRDREDRILFTVRELLRSQNGLRAFDYIAPKNPVASDRSGLVFLRTVYAPNNM